MSPAASTRWCPTPEQLTILEDMYRDGVKTPNATQIQQITAHLSLYGKIEGKNVFYWFQNHKARDRQKLRRKLCRQQQQQHHRLLFNDFQASTSLVGLHHHYKGIPSPQEGVVGVLQQAPCQMTMNSTRKIDICYMEDMDKWMKMMEGQDCFQSQMITMDYHNMNSSPVYCSSSSSRPPLKTLELFPVKSSSSSGVKDVEGNNSKYFSCCPTNNNNN